MLFTDSPNLIHRLRSFVHERLMPAPKASKVWRKAGGTEFHAFWMLAYPVHLVLGRDHFILSKPAPLLVAGEHAQAIINSLNLHFSAQNLHFYHKNSQWFIGLDEDPLLCTFAFASAVNQDITPYLPNGEGALAWAKITNEIQMLLFNHPVNAEREARGELTINSLWFDGLSAA